MLLIAATLIALSLLGAILLLGFSLHGVWLAWQGKRRRQGFALRVRACQWLSDDLLHLELASPWRLPLPCFAAGQFLTLLAQPEGERPLRRCYSLAAWQARPWHYQLCIKREPDGRMSNWLAERVRPGLRLQVLAPAGHFHLQDDHGPELLLIAGGVGITPMRAMLQAWAERPLGRRVTLIYAGRDRAALAYHQEFVELAAQRADFRYCPALSRDPQAPPDWQGRLNAARLAAVLTGDCDVFLCAGQALLDHSLALLRDAGVAESRLHWEAFGAQALGAGSGTFALHWQDEALQYTGQPSLLHALHEQGIDLPADCWGGHCGSCRVRCSGEVEWRQPPAGMLPAGQILACCCIPRAAVQLAPVD
ncbi:2Fe-2S iron-sulfur cluster-binding protein [Ectopseudomonas guguanensis]|uniref:2Fe-2S iron-sulfur cluster-binding protein n=1 Tax=Ectopseudomonas guguanensis TaxID=1198456 RepID=UPI0039C32149